MLRSCSLAVWRGARRRLLSQTARSAKHSEFVTSPWSVSRQPHAVSGRRSFWQRAGLQSGEGAGGSHSSASALAEQIAKDDENARRFLIAATGGTLAMIAFGSLKGNATPKGGAESTGHDHGSTESAHPHEEEAPLMESPSAVATANEHEVSESEGEEVKEADTDAAATSQEKEAGDGADTSVVVEETEGTTEPGVEGAEGGSAQEAAAESEKEEDCGFCAFMKAGPCGEVFTGWEQCVDKAEAEGKSIVDECVDATMKLRDCMGQNMEYYGVVLEAEKQMGEIEQRDAEAREILARQKEKGEREAQELLQSFEEALDVARSVLCEPEEKKAEEEP